MASPYRSLIAVFFVLLSPHLTLSVDIDPQEATPSPSPIPVIDKFSSISSAPTNPPSPASHISSPPSPPPSSSNGSNPPSPTPSQSSQLPSTPAESPSDSPAPSPLESNSSPTPSPAPAHFADEVLEHGDELKSSGKMSGGKKAGIVIGVALAAGTVVMGGCVYRKRQENIRRSRYGYTARAGMI